MTFINDYWHGGKEQIKRMYDNPKNCITFELDSDYHEFFIKKLDILDFDLFGAVKKINIGSGIIKFEIQFISTIGIIDIIKYLNTNNISYTFKNEL